jgi:hypothetical protein
MNACIIAGSRRFGRIFGRETQVQGQTESTSNQGIKNLEEIALCFLRIAKKRQEVPETGFSDI